MIVDGGYNDVAENAFGGISKDVDVVVVCGFYKIIEIL